MAKIYHLLDEAEPFSESRGGAISRWVANVLRDGEETIICPAFDSSWGYPAERLCRLPNWTMCNRVHPLLYRSPWTVQKVIYQRILRSLLEKLTRGDVLYIHNRPECADVLARAAGQRGFHLVLHMHNSLLHPRSRKHFAALKHIPVVFCSEFLRKEVHVAYPNHFQKTHVVYNGANSKTFYAGDHVRRATPQVISTGRVIPAKGVHVLLEAMRILERRGVAATCTIVGGSAFGDSGRTRYIRTLERLRPSNTELIGYRSGKDLARLLRNADIFCCPSICNDAFPLAPLEAMASGLPVVASKTGGIPEALAYGGGILVPPNDAEALAAALQQLLNDSCYREKLGAEAVRACHGHFLWDNVQHQYRSVIRGLVS
jgi:spore coat protein SA